MKSIVIENLSLMFSNNKVLDKINVHLQIGELVGIVGPNGSGKTSLLKVILGLYKKFEGEVSLGNFKYAGTLEEADFSPSLSGYENLEYLCRNKEAVNRFIDMFNMHDYIYDRVKTYSQGMRQRLAIVYAFSQETDIIIFDEPLNALDKNARDIFRKCIQLKEMRDKLIIISSHISSNLEFDFDKVLVMNNGKLSKVNMRMRNDAVYKVKFKSANLLDDFSNVWYSKLEVIDKETCLLSLDGNSNDFLIKYVRFGVSEITKVSSLNEYHLFTEKEGDDHY
jgi:ABC-type multidrug transport system ATPase subunit